MLTGVVLARNEQSNLPRCLESLRFCDSLLVIDDNSTDATAQIAKKFAATVVTHPLNDDFAAQHNFALTQVKSGWALFVDADECVTPDLTSEITQELKNPSFHAFFIPRQDIMWNRRLKHGDSSTKLVRLGRVGMGRWTNRVHETWEVNGRVGELKNLLLHYPHPTFYEFLRKINHYSTMRAKELKGLGIRTNIFEIIFLPPLKLLHLYTYKLGFLDGTPGLICALTMSLHTFLVRGKLFLMSKTA